MVPQRNYLLHYALYMMLWLMAVPALAGLVLLARPYGIHAVRLGGGLLLPETILALTRIAIGASPAINPSPRASAAHPR